VVELPPFKQYFTRRISRSTSFSSSSSSELLELLLLRNVATNRGGDAARGKNAGTDREREDETVGAREDATDRGKIVVTGRGFHIEDVSARADAMRKKKIEIRRSAIMLRRSKCG
jgi:hypothetical protein